MLAPPVKDLTAVEIVAALKKQKLEPTRVLFAALSEWQHPDFRITNFFGTVLGDRVPESERTLESEILALGLFWNYLASFHSLFRESEDEDRIEGWLNSFGKEIFAGESRAVRRNYREHLNTAIMGFLDEVFAAHIPGEPEDLTIDEDNLGDLLIKAQDCFQPVNMEIIKELVLYTSLEGLDSDSTMNNELISISIILAMNLSCENENTKEIRALGGRARNSPCPCGSGRKVKQCCGR